MSTTSHHSTRRTLFVLGLLAVFFGSAITTQRPTQAAQGNDAQFIGQDVPQTMRLGETRTVSLTFRNTGTESWNKIGGPGDYVNAFRLKSQNPADNTTWGLSFVPIPRAPIAQGELAVFSFMITAPQTPGTYHFQWQMNQGGVGWFGDLTPNVPVVVVAPAPSRLPRPLTPRAGFVIPQNKQLTLDGRTWWSKGANWLGAQSVKKYCPLADGAEIWCNMRYLDADEWNPQAIEAELKWLHEVLGINTLRLNALGTEENGDWRPGYDTRLLEFTRMAYRQGIRIGWTLFFGVPSFECPQPDGTYQSCYLAGKPMPPGAVLMPPGSVLEQNVLKAVRNFATLMKDEPGVFGYEVGNEILLSNTRVVGYQEQILSYITRILAEVRRADPYHLFFSGEVAVLQGPNDPSWPWLEGKGVDFVKFADVHNLNGGNPFSLEDVVDVIGTHMYQPPETVEAATDIVLAAARKPVLFGEFGGGGTPNLWEWPEPNEQGRWHAATIAQVRRLAGGWVWNPTPFTNFKPGTYRVEQWTDNAGRKRPLIVLFGPPERRIKALSFNAYTFAPQDNILNPLAMLPAAREFANRQVQFVGQNVPTTMEVGKQYPVTITLRNAGDSPWDRGGNSLYAWRLKSQNPADNTTWGVNAVPLTNAPVDPGEIAVFSFMVTAPQTPGTYHFQWGLNQAAVGWFGDPTPNVSITVSAPIPPPNSTSTPPSSTSTPPNATTTPPSIPDPCFTVFSASPNTIDKGGLATLSWSATNATGCTASNGWSSTKGVSGTFTVRPEATSIYVLTCRNSIGHETRAEVAVTVRTPVPPTSTSTPPTPTPTSTPQEPPRTTSTIPGGIGSGPSSDPFLSSLLNANLDASTTAPAAPNPLAAKGALILLGLFAGIAVIGMIAYVVSR